MEAIEGAVIGGGTKQGQANKPAHDQIGGEQPFELGVTTGVSPGANKLGADQLIDRESRGSAWATAMLIGGTGSNNGSQVIVLSDLDERMVGAARQNLAIDQGGQPRENWREETADEILKIGRDVGQIARASTQG